MAVVMKFGGSSVADGRRLANAAGIVARRAANGDRVVVVVSAQGDFTDEMIERAGQVADRPAQREMDALLASGEQISMALMAMALGSRGVRAVSLAGWQAGIQTAGRHGAAEICGIDTSRIERELDSGNVVVVAGFQGVNGAGDITTLGRGGSDTTAVALAAALGAGECLIFTDVDGVFSADPRVVGDAVRHSEISYDEMLELASLGAQVLHDRAVELAKRQRVPVRVLSSLEEGEGTRLVAHCPAGRRVTAVTSDRNVSCLAVETPSPDGAQMVQGALAGAEIRADILCHKGGRLLLAICSDMRQQALEAIDSLRRQGAVGKVAVKEPVAKISVVGRGLGANASAVARAQAAAEGAGAAVLGVLLGPMGVSLIVPGADRERVLCAVHAEFFADIQVTRRPA